MSNYVSVLKSGVFFCLFLSCHAPAFAGFSDKSTSGFEKSHNAAPVGYWKQIDNEKSIVSITREEGGFLLMGISGKEVFSYSFYLSKLKSNTVAVVPGGGIASAGPRLKQLEEGRAFIGHNTLMRYEETFDSLRLTPITLRLVEDDINKGLLEGKVEYTCLPEPEEKASSAQSEKRKTACPIYDVEPATLRDYIEKNNERIFDRNNTVILQKIY